MASIKEYKSKDGKISYDLKIKRKNIEITKTFMSLEDAEIYAFYKERLIDNIDNFEIPIEERITLKQLFEIKIDDSKHLNSRSILDVKNAFDLLHQYISLDKFVSSVKYEDWEKAAKSMFQIDVFKGAKTEGGKRKMSSSTLRRHFACFSSSFSNAISRGFNIENNPLKIMQNYINPMLKKEK